MIKTQAFICDIDGTIADHTGLRGHYEYEKVLQDKPISATILVLHFLILNDYFPSLTPIFVSGRPEWCREDTLAWMNKHLGFEVETKELFMRPSFLPEGDKKDYRPDYIVKEEIYHKDIEPYYNIGFAIDDRPQVLKMWQKLGIFTFAVGTPWIEF